MASLASLVASLAYPVEASLVAYPVEASLVAFPVEASLVAFLVVACPVEASFAELDHQFDNLSVASSAYLVASSAYLVASLVRCPVEASLVASQNFERLSHPFVVAPLVAFLVVVVLD